MSRKTFLALTAVALAIGTLPPTSASAGFRPGHFPSPNSVGFSNVRLPHIPLNRFSNVQLPHIPINRFSNIRLPHIPINRFSNVHLPHLTQGGGYGGYQGGGYASPVAAYAAPTYAAPTPSYTPAPASCLSKTYLQDGSALFTDNCTGEQASTAPANPQSGS